MLALQVRSSSATFQHRWELGACPWWLRFAVEHGACLRRPTALKPSFVAAVALRRVLSLPPLASGLGQAPGAASAEPAGAPGALEHLESQSELSAGAREHPLSTRHPRTHSGETVSQVRGVHAISMYALCPLRHDFACGEAAATVRQEHAASASLSLRP